MDSSNLHDSTARIEAVSSSRLLHQPVADHVENAAKVRRIVSIAQVSLFAISIVLSLLLDLVRYPAPAAVAFDILMLCGFAVQNVFWAHRPLLGKNSPTLVIEVGRRCIQVAGLTLFSALVVLHASGVDWQSLHVEKSFLLVMGIVLGGFAVLVFCRNSSRRPRRIMVIGNDDAFQFARRLRLDLGNTEIVFVPLQELLTGAAGKRRAGAAFHPAPRIVEYGPDVALLFCSEEDALKRVSSLLAPLPIDVLLYSEKQGALTTGSLVHLAQLTFVRIFPKPLTLQQRALKRGFDVLGSLALLLLTSPILLFGAIGVAATSRGPIIFRQPRIGLRGTPFTILKFRTMQDAARDFRADTPTAVNDPRVTWFGSLLRRTSIDELPQLLNVLAGDMSLIGPRPHAMNGEAFSDVAPNYQARHRVKPGITGLAQILGWRGLANTSDKIEQRTANDLRYINEWSLQADAMILVRTTFAIWGKNAF